ncbi:unnamed protein product [Clavelina lepadiformis]|uniref:Uncharacterized protein n=1 Tax=Clavelina lepadiformis TaxID=159417 RepID=A0ABP0EWM1_CLALP
MEKKQRVRSRLGKKENRPGTADISSAEVRPGQTNIKQTKSGASTNFRYEEFVPPFTEYQPSTKKSALDKFFATELSDNEDNDISQLPAEFAENQQYHQCEEKGKVSKQFKSRRNKNNNRRSNIDIFIDETISHYKSDLEKHHSRKSAATVEPETIIRHRPVISERMEPDYFVPRKNTRRKHNCNDNQDVTRQPYVSRQGLPLPVSVISEKYQESIFIPALSEKQLFSFGEIYEDNLMHNIHKYLEVDTFHRVAYVGQKRGSMASIVEKHFCLINPIHYVFPGKIDHKDVTENKKLLAFNISHVGAEEFFAQMASSKQPDSFDRVIIHDSVQYFTNIEVTLRNVMKTLRQFGKILIIHRPGCLNTLPYFEAAKDRLNTDDTPYRKIIHSLQKTGADVEWDLVHVPIVMPTSNWLAMLKAKYPPHMEIMSNYEITCGLRELSEGPLKYLQEENMEVEDRLMFITASQPTFDCTYPSVQRVGGASQVLKNFFSFSAR